MKPMLISLTLAMSLAVGHANAATTKPATAAPSQVQSYAAGGTPIAIPSPSTKMVEAGNDRGLMEIFCPINNRLIACFLPPRQLASLKKKNQSGKILDQYAMVEVPRRYEYADFNERDFQGVAEGMKEHFGDVIGSASQKVEGDFNHRMKELDIKNAKLTLGKPLILGSFFTEPNACGYGMVSASSMFNKKVKMGAALVLMRVRDRMLFGYLYAVYKDKSTIKWLRATSQRWADSILKANRD